MSSLSFLVLGSGAWGSALALHLFRQGHLVTLWGHDPLEVELLEKTRRLDQYLPGILFPDSLKVTKDLAKAFEMAGDSPIILIVVPSFAFDEMTQKIKPYLSSSTPIFWGTKGLSASSEFLHVVCERNTGPRPMGVLSGPSFALEVAKGLPTAITLATNSDEWGKRIQEAFHGETMRIYLSSDIIGVQLGGVVKNVIAIAVGMSDGLGYGANARSALITRGLSELSRLGVALGATASTFMGLSGLGDMVLTCTDNQSRNRRFGLLLGEGKSSSDATQAVGKVVEGKSNVQQVMDLFQKYQLDLPICELVNAVLFEGISSQKAVSKLLMRTPKKEI